MLYIDFDRTLFNTNQFVADRDIVLKQEFGIEITKADTKKFYRYINDLYAYDFYAHMASYGLNVDDITGQLASGLRNRSQSYIYDDAKAMIDRYDFAVLTFGQDDYQHLKFKFAPELDSKKKIVVFEHKDEYIVRHHEGDEAVILVDDKVDAARGHASIDFIHLDRGAEKSLRLSETGVHIGSLTGLPEAINHYVNNK